MTAGWADLTRLAEERWRALVTVTVLAVVIYLVLLAQLSGGRVVTRQLGLSAPSEPFTELYFADPASLPAIAPLITNVTSLAFVIHNAGHKAMTYTWSVGVPHTRWLRDGRTAVNAGQRVTITQPVVVNCPVPHRGTVVRARVQVTLSAPTESIGYWVTCDD